MGIACLTWSAPSRWQGRCFACSSSQGILRGLLHDGTWIVGAEAAVRPTPCQ